MKREDVYILIDGERQYQDINRSNGIPLSDADTSISSWILYMEEHLNRAKKAIYDLDETNALEQIRKATALGVACMEYNETPAR